MVIRLDVERLMKERNMFCELAAFERRDLFVRPQAVSGADLFCHRFFRRLWQPLY
jgi:hypothetical protein